MSWTQAINFTAFLFVCRYLFLFFISALISSSYLSLMTKCFLFICRYLYLFFFPALIHSISLSRIEHAAPARPCSKNHIYDVSVYSFVQSQRSRTNESILFFEVIIANSQQLPILASPGFFLICYIITLPCPTCVLKKK